MHAALALGAAVAALALSLPAQAVDTVYTTTLTGPGESPPNASPGTGFATVTLNPDLHTLRVQATFSGLTGTTTASHIHCCITVPGGAAGVATTTPTFADFPLGVTAGTYDKTLLLDLASSWNPAFVTLVGGLANAYTTLVDGLNNGTSYFNIHTSTFGGGEIRGFLINPVAAIPEPETYALLLAGLGLLGSLAKRRQASRRPRGD
jgi:hypothetical protein